MDGGYKDFSHAIDFAHFLRNASIMSAYGIKVNEPDGLPGLDVATPHVNVQSAVGLLDTLSPVNV